MSNTFDVRGRLDHWKKGDLPENEMVCITVAEYATGSDGVISLTPQLATDREVDHEVDALIGSLERARKKAKEKIRKNNEKVRSSL